MTGADREAYLNAFSAAKKRVEAEGRRICHVIWRDGHLGYTSAKPIDESEFSSVVRPDPQGTLL
jgi:hypothetical protein